MTTRGTAPRLGHRGDRRTAVKRFPAADTAAFKCWGSGHLNEGVAARVLGAGVPEVVETWSDGDDDLLAYRWVEGTPLRPGAGPARAAGALLGRISATTGPYWGSLDGRHVFPDPVSALASRFAHAVGLVAAVDPVLAGDLARWAPGVLGGLVLPGRPCLVHGDFGPANLVETESGLVALDWEHARWGHPAEDWAKIRLGLRFPEPNAFDPSRWPIEDVAAGAGADPARGQAPDALSTFLLVYYAACLGSFFPGRPNVRLDWVRHVVLGNGVLDAVG